ncbi:MAG: PLP-dependent aspartate aminotransferase family protein [Balneolales bacterium]|nr:PLP-dependent aspartate aminotransferase family protein [Balneolales bacterium]
MHIQTRTIHAGYSPQGPSQPVVSAIQPGTIFTHPEKGFDSSNGSYGYARYGNPNRNELETMLANLENGAIAAAFSSGMSAITAVFQVLSPGDHVVVCDDVYHGTRAVLNDIMIRWGLECTYVDVTRSENVADAIRPNTKLVWLETPSNPRMLICDIAEITRLVRAKTPDGAYIHIGVDNTWATPVLTNPLDLGADLVMHSCTKYIGGHSDVLAGAIISRENDTYIDRIRTIQKQTGAVASPFDSWMLVRSLKTLVARMRMHCENAIAVAKFLDSHPKVEAVFYPGLPHSPGHDIAKKQMRDFGGMVSVLFSAEKEQILKEIGSARLFKVATSLGGVESLWEHRQSSEGPRSKTPPNLVRMSVGIEHPDDLIADLQQVLDQL